MAGLAGFELGDRVIHRPVKQDPRMAVFIANVCLKGTGAAAEPTLIIGRRTMGTGRSFYIPLSVAWQYNERAILEDKIDACARVLFDHFPSKAERRVIGDVMMQYLPELFTFAPDTGEDGKKRAAVERVLEQYQVQIKTEDGKILLDASSPGTHIQ